MDNFTFIDLLVSQPLMRRIVRMQSNSMITHRRYFYLNIQGRSQYIRSYNLGHRSIAVAESDNLNVRFIRYEASISIVLVLGYDVVGFAIGCFEIFVRFLVALLIIVVVVEHIIVIVSVLA